MNKERIDKLKDSLLGFLRRNRDDKGVMASLRCALVPSRESRAWPCLAGLGFDLCDPQERIVALTVAAAFAIAPPGHGQSLKPGELLRSIVRGEHGDDGLSTFETRLLRLLACDSREELAGFLRPIFQTARQKGLSVSEDALFDDLFYWGEKTKLRWAQQYWGRGRE